MSRPTVAVEIDGMWWKLQDPSPHDPEKAVVIAPGGTKWAIPKAILDEYVKLRQMEASS